MKLALAGYGSLAKVYINAVEEIDELKISAVYDCNMEKVKQSIKDINIVGDYCDLLRSDCDAVMLCVPAYMQHDMAKKAADFGKNVICQIPPALNSHDIIELAEYFKLKNLRLIPAMFDRYFANIFDVRKHLNNNTIGNIGVVNIRRYCPKANNKEQNWYNDFDLSGGCIYQLMVCDIDLITQLFGEVESAFGYHRTLEGVDYAVMTLVMKCGVLVNIEALFGYKGEFSKAYELSGSKGNICFDSLLADSSRIIGGGLNSEHFSLDCSLNAANHNPYKLMLIDIVKSINMGDDSILDIDDLIYACRIADMCGQSISVKVV